MIDLKKLTQFNPAIIYCFDPEISPEHACGSNDYKKTLLHTSSQYIDLFQAYMYAQDHVLPRLTGNLNSVTNQQFIGFLKQTHQLIGATVVQGTINPAGEFSKEVVLRWEYRFEFASEFFQYLIGAHECKNNTSMAKFLANKCKTRENDMLAFLNICDKVKDMHDVAIHPSQIEEVARLDLKGQSGIHTVYKLQTAYNTNKLTPNEKEAIRKVVKIGMFVNEIPAAMEQYAQNTLKDLARCSKTNIDEIAAFLAKSFYALTEIHPFDNGNGRVATCFMNLYLRALGQPSILLRNPGEKNNPNSDYSKAFDQVESSIVPLQTLIRNKILQAQQKAFADESLKNRFQEKIQLHDICARITSKNPDFDIIATTLKYKPLVFMQAKFMEPNASLAFSINEMLKLAIEIENAMTPPPVNATYSLTTVTKEQKDQLKSGLHQLSGHGDWEIYTKTGLVALHRFENEEQARATVETLEKGKLVHASVKRLTGNNSIWVVKCEEMKFQQIVSHGIKQADLQTNTNPGQKKHV